MPSESFLALLLAAVISSILTPLFAEVAPRFGLLDVPNERSSHAHIVPRGGGLALLVAAIGAVSLLDPPHAVAVLVAGAVALGLVGFVDDLASLPATPRLAAQLTVPLVCAWIVADHQGAMLVGVVGIAMIWCTGYVNAFNFMDGINGISATQTILSGMFLALVARHVSADPLEISSWAITGAALGFLPFNAVRPRVFLGDVGSYGIGFWLAATALLLWNDGVSPLILIGPFALYLGDTTIVLIRRWHRGDSLLDAHREHAYQLLNQSGWSHVQVTSLCAVISTTNSALMFAAVDSNLVVQFGALAVVILIVMGYVRFATARHRETVRAAE